MNSFKALAEAFTIFAKYEDGKFQTHAEHDELFSGPEPKEVIEDDLKRLEELGWTADEVHICFHLFT